MRTVCHLQQDIEAIANMQRASLDTGPVGLLIAHGLIGSSEWWSKVESGALASNLSAARLLVFGPVSGEMAQQSSSLELATGIVQSGYANCHRRGR